MSKDRNVPKPQVEQSAPDAAETILEVSSEATSRVEGKLHDVNALIDKGESEDAWALCEEILKIPDLPLNTAVKAALLIKQIGGTEIADSVFSATYDKIKSRIDQLKDPERAMLPAAEALADMGHYDEAETLCQKALAQVPDNMTVAVGYAAFLVYRGRLDEAMQVANDYCDRTDRKFDATLHFATIFNHLNCDGPARACLELSSKHCKTSTQRAKLDFFLASQGMTTKKLDQHGMAVELFDGFAESYDKQLSKLDNNGPSMVFTALEELQLPKNASRRILDAGCGTGLCADFLRPYAKELFGVDLSVKMLEISREKGGYDFLARTDLSEIATYPEGTFNVIICADVLVYFGSLNTVIGNFGRILTPGGWLLLTVEHEGDPAVKTGFKLYPSGRHKHTVDYLTKTLAGAGFPKPKTIKHARLRNELGKPIFGTLVAVQKPALSFG